MIINISHESAIELIKRVISLWPDEIKIDDKTLFVTGGARIPILSDVQKRISDEIEELMPSPTTLADSVNWAIFSVAHQLARMSYTVRPSEIDENYLIKYLKDNSKWDIVE